MTFLSPMMALWSTWTLSCTDASSMYIPPGLDAGSTNVDDTASAEEDDAASGDSDSDSDSDSTSDTANVEFAADAAAATCDTYNSCDYFNGYKDRLLECVDVKTASYTEKVTDEDCSFQSKYANECIAIIYNWNCDELNGETDEPWWLAGEVPACAQICG